MLDGLGQLRWNSFRAISPRALTTPLPNSAPKPNFARLCTPQTDFSAVVKLASASDDNQAPRLDMLYLRVLEAGADVSELAELVYYQVINYALPQKKREELFRQQSANDLSGFSKLQAEAKRIFIKFDDSAEDNKRYTEVGEVIAFCVANHFLQAGQVASKMALKTNSEMPVFGLDGIHVRCLDDGTVAAYYLESKMVGDARDGLRQYVDSASGFATDREQQLNEYRILTDLSNLDALSGHSRETALHLFNPYSPARETIRERFVGVVTYSEDLFKTRVPVSDSTPPNANDTAFQNAYRKLRDPFTSAMRSRISTRGLEAGRCRAFVIAVPSIEDLKIRFKEAMTR